MKSKKSIKSIVTMAILGIAVLFFINISFAANTAKVNVETANLRETADSNSKILEQLSLDQEVEIIEKSGDWYKVKALGITGYLRQDLITVEQSQEEIESTSSEENQESAQSEETSVAPEETNTTSEESKEAQQDDSSAIKEDGATKRIKEDTKLKIVPAINATDIIEVKKDEEVIVTETINDWVCVETETTKGWLRKDKLKDIEETETAQPEENKEAEATQPVEEKVLKTLFINAETVNVRKEPNTESEVVVKLSVNTSVDVYSEENGWSKVKVDGKEGYISSALLSDKKQETSRSLTTTRKQEEQKQEQVSTTTQQTTATESGQGAKVVETAKSYIGSKYVYGASGPNSFDCSGFTSYIYKQFGVSLSRTAAGQYGNGTAVNRSDLQLGDLIMFGPSASAINHVGIYIGGGRIVHAANTSRGVTTDTINSGYYKNNYVGARRVI